MRNTLFLLTGILFSFTLYAQDNSPAAKISPQDSVLLRNFWADLQASIKKRDKHQLSELCDFPFYCSPCVDDTTLIVNDHVSIKVTEKLLLESQYNYFFEGAVKKEIEKHPDFTTDLFYPSVNETNKKKFFQFPYTIVAPSKRWEGLQGFIYIEKIKGKYKITGIDTVP